jgi:stage V sporulation protein B
MLQAVGRVDLPVKLLFIGVIVKVIINYTFVSIPQINIGGAGAGTLICYMIITIMAVFLLCRETKIVPNLMSIFLKPLIAAVCCVASAWLTNNILVVLVNHRIATLAAMAVAGSVYVVSLFLFRAITKSDILMLPKGKKIVKTLAKYKILR